MMYQLCCAISGMKTPEEAAELLQDLLSYQESEMIAKRLKIAEYLSKGISYEEIKESLGAGYGTIARVQEWLIISGKGYRGAIGRMKGAGDAGEKSFSKKEDALFSIKKRYPMYYWPEAVLENIVKTMNKKQKDKIKRVVEEIDKSKEKSEIYKSLKKIGF